MELIVLVAVLVALLAAAAALTRKQRRMLGGAQRDAFRRAGDDRPRSASPGDAVVRNPSDFGGSI